jgi:GT2 family glycosyltransferase
MIDLTAIIPTCNRPEMACDLVRYLRHDLGWTCPIVLVDQSEDRGQELSRRLAEGAWPDVAHIPQTGRGAGRARNEAARRANSSWLLFLDDDVRPFSGYLNELEAFLQASPWSDAVTGKVQSRGDWQLYQDNPEEWSRQLPSAASPRRLPWSRTGLGPFLKTPRSPYETLAVGVSGGNLAVSRRAFFGVGGFDERIISFGTDQELGLRLWWYGYRTCYRPRLIVFHLHHSTGGNLDHKPRHRRRVDADSYYLFLRWFPGSLACLGSFLESIRSPRRVPRNFWWFLHALREARGLVREGPRYLSPPAPRELLSAADAATAATDTNPPSSAA